MSSSRAIYVDGNAELSIIEIKERYTPTDAQSLVSVKYSAINPADLRHCYFGWHSSVAGYEYIGPVLDVGPNSPFKKGDILFGISQIGPQRPFHAGAHQDFMLAEPFMTYKLPSHLAAREEEWLQAVGWPVGVRTAVDALFNPMGFGLPLPNNKDADGKENWLVNGTDPRNRAILIWGGASAVGLAAIQIARFAGFSPIFTTASPHNHATLLDIGVTACFDYRSPTVVSDIRQAVADSGKPLSTIFDAVTAGNGWMEPPSLTPVDLSKSSPAIAKQCLTPGVPKEDVRLSSTLLVESDPDWKFCMSLRIKEDSPEYHDRLEAVSKWILEHSEEVGYKVPKVRIVEGDEGIKMIKDVFGGKVSMEKVVIKHPL